MEISVPEIKTIAAKVLVGEMRLMTFENNQTPLLWQSFMPKRNLIKNTISDDLFSVQILSKFEPPSPKSEFQKWACREVESFDQVPDGMQVLEIPIGLYAVFNFKGSDTEGYKVFQWIFEDWLPYSTYEFDNRPQFEILTEKYKRNSPDSEEDIYIPIKLKQ